MLGKQQQTTDTVTRSIFKVADNVGANRKREGSIAPNSIGAAKKPQAQLGRNHV